MSAAAKPAEKHSITLQVNVAKRVLAVFHGLYPDMLEKKLIDYDTASIDTKGLASIVETLSWLEKNEDVIKSVVAKELARREQTRVANDARAVPGAVPPATPQSREHAQAMDEGGRSS